MYVLFSIFVCGQILWIWLWKGFTDRYVRRLEKCASLTEFDCPEVTLCSWQDYKFNIHTLTHILHAHTHTHTYYVYMSRTYAFTHACMHAQPPPTHTHTHTHARSHTHTHTHTLTEACKHLSAHIYIHKYIYTLIAVTSFIHFYDLCMCVCVDQES